MVSVTGTVQYYSPRDYSSSLPLDYWGTLAMQVKGILMNCSKLLAAVAVLEGVRCQQELGKVTSPPPPLDRTVGFPRSSLLVLAVLSLWR